MVEKQEIVSGIAEAVKAADRKEHGKKRLVLPAAIIIVLVLIAAFFLLQQGPFIPPLFPSCENGALDAGEEGVDCGGSCFAQCLSEEEKSNELFLSPSSVTDVGVDGLDRIYVVDSGRHRLLVYSKELNFLREVGEEDFTSGGSGDYQFMNPRAVAIGTGRVYVSDRFNKRIQVFDGKLQYVETISEGQYEIHGMFSGMSAFNGKLAAASDPHDTVYLIEPGNSAAGTKITGLNKPEGVVFSDGGLFVADSANHKIKVFDLQGNMLQEFGGLGNTNNTFHYPTGIDVKGSRIAVADQQNNRVQVFDKEFNYVATLSYEFNNPTKVAIDSAGRFIVADSGNNRVVIFDSKFNFVDSLQGIAKSDYLAYSFSPRYAHFDSKGRLFVSEGERQQVTILDSSGKYLGKIAGSQGGGNNQFNDPRDFAFDSKGNIYVADKENSRVQVFDSEGKYFATIGGKKGSGDYEFNSPRAVAIDSQGRVFVVDKGNDRIQVFDSSLKYLSTLKGNRAFQFKEPVPIAVDSSGNVYVADSKSSNIHMFNSELSFVKDIDAGSDIIEMEGGIAFDSRGRLLLVDIEGHKVRMLDPQTGNVIKTIGKQGATGNYSFDWPHGLAIALNGEVFVVDMGNRRIQVFDSQLNYKRTIDGGADGLIETSS